jgi:hypothetical protein
MIAAYVRSHHDFIHAWANYFFLYVQLASSQGANILLLELSHACA